MNVVPFPKSRARKPASQCGFPEGWPDGQLGVELEGLARLVYERGVRSGNGCTLEKARCGALEALNEMTDRMELRKRVQQERMARMAELVVERNLRHGVHLRIQAARAAAYNGDDPLLSKLMAATHREVKARIARSKK